MSLKTEIDTTRLPAHVAVIMDGNGRWAKQQGQMRVFGHKNGVNSVREVSEAAAELGIQVLTLYAFSTENWNRPHEEVEALMELLVHTIHAETETLMKNDIRLETIGDTQSLPPSCQRELAEAIQKTSGNKRMALVLALSYSSRWEIVEAARRLAKLTQAGELKPEDINADVFGRQLTTSRYPDPELLIRTSGELRVSNFLLWQIAYAEFYFTETLWPDFDREEFYKAILDYQNRERRFGKTSDQLLKSADSTQP
ncbi:MAG: isoprenyl transferase [Bacteroidia bacterium]|jgi:undecaprenyl diphosphate synthase|nr:isoprenyl transferase [Bacteroidia bacterium]